jgi:hypothetical protein
MPRFSTAAISTLALLSITLMPAIAQSVLPFAIAPQFEDAWQFSENLAPVRLKQK